MKVLVTGGSGFLGRQIVEVAEERGHTVYAPRSSEFNLETMQGIAEFFDALPGVDPKIDVVIHSAAYYGGIGINQAEPATIFQKNTLMAVNVFEIAREYGVKKVVPIGSACSYPGYLQGDLKEEDFWSGKLHDSVESYGFSKKLQQVGQRAYHKQYGIESNHLILTNLYGPHDVFTEYRSHVVSALIKKFVDANKKGETVILWGDGSPIREFLYVRDAAEAIVKAMALPHDPEPINIGTGEGTSIRELAEVIQKYTGYTGRIDWDTEKPNGTARKVLDSEKRKQALTWEPRYSLENGLRETIEWYAANQAEADQRE